MKKTLNFLWEQGTMLITKLFVLAIGVSALLTPVGLGRYSLNNNGVTDLYVTVVSFLLLAAVGVFLGWCLWGFAKTWGAAVVGIIISCTWILIATGAAMGGDMSSEEVQTAHLQAFSLLATCVLAFIGRRIGIRKFKENRWWFVKTDID